MARPVYPCTLNPKIFGGFSFSFCPRGMAGFSSESKESNKSRDDALPTTTSVTFVLKSPVMRVIIIQRRAFPYRRNNERRLLSRGQV